MPRSIGAAGEPATALLDDVVASSSHPFVRDLTPQDLACGICWKRCPANPPPRWDRETSQTLCSMEAYPSYVRICARAKEKCGTNLLSQVGMRKGHHSGLDDIRVGQQSWRDMHTRDILSAPR